jgi:hypothetical protein
MTAPRPPLTSVDEAMAYGLSLGLNEVDAREVVDVCRNHLASTWDRVHEALEARARGEDWRP